MLTTRIVAPRRGRDDAEKPFWISFADLMTALMVLFLVVMGVALLAITNTVSEREEADAQHRREIEAVLDRLVEAASHHAGVTVDRARRVIDFGDRARFAFDRSSLAPEQQVLLRRFVPEILELADGELGRKVMKRIVVEGYADRTGTYLGNLALSLQRSERVLCALFANGGDQLLSDAQKASVRDLFLVGGYSFNAAKASDEASRRVEMRLEFLGVGEARAAAPTDASAFGDCALR